MCFDAIGNMYIGDDGNNRVRKITTASIISTFVGNGIQGYSGDNGQASSAELYQPYSTAFDAVGNLYFSEVSNSVIRKVNTSGIISTFVGTGTAGYSGDGGTATIAKLGGPIGIDFDGAGNLYIADADNNCIRMVNTLGIISTIAGTGTAGFGGDGGQATAATLYSPFDVTFDATGNLYIADSQNNRIRIVNTMGIISTIAGNGTVGYSGDEGQAINAELDKPIGVICDGAGNLYIADYGNSCIRMVNTTGIISTIVGTGTAGFSGDGGNATAAELDSPHCLAFDVEGNLYISDDNNNRIRKVTNVGQMGLQQVAGINNQVTVYPNPVSNSLQVSFSGNIQNAMVEIYNMIGESVKQVSANSNQVSINISDLSEGVYSVRIQTNEGTEIKKIIKQ
jgi:sugar lactone lactonase YvrE